MVNCPNINGKAIELVGIEMMVRQTIDIYENISRALTRHDIVLISGGERIKRIHFHAHMYIEKDGASKTFFFFLQNAYYWKEDLVFFKFNQVYNAGIYSRCHIFNSYYSIKLEPRKVL
jgi:hypothetical protein